MSGNILECQNDVQYRCGVANAGDKLVAAEFYANWSEPSLSISTILQEIHQETMNLDILRVNSDLCTELLIKYKVSIIPTVKLIKNGIQLAEIHGARASCLKESIRVHLND